MRDAPVRLQDQNKPTTVEVELRQVVAAFARLQEDRYTADYDVGRSWSRSDVSEVLAVADDAFKTWRSIRSEQSAQSHLLSMFGAKR